MASEETYLVESPGVDCVEVTVSEDSSNETNQDSNGPKPMLIIENLAAMKSNVQPYHVPSDSSGLVLLSHLCELSQKQPLNPQRTESPILLENNGKAVIVERIQETEYTVKASSLFGAADVAVDASPESIDAETGSPASETEASVTPSGKVRRVTKTLKFPPCFVCGGKASGSHYGVNSCEACKGFFRRYLMRREEYKCNRVGNCEIINRNRGNCSGCRLKKCLKLGMAKEKSKLGRYTLAKRTETIKEVNKLEGKDDPDFAVNSLTKNLSDAEIPTSEEHRYCTPRLNIITSSIAKGGSESPAAPETFCNEIVSVLVSKLLNLMPFGPKIRTKEDIRNAMKTHHERYKVKVQLFGQLPPVPSEEYYKLYKEFGIDADDRMKQVRDEEPFIQGLIERYCEFAKSIPQFINLSVRDKSNLLKSSRYDFFVLAKHHGFSEEYQMMLGKSGNAYHLNETADKFCSRKLCLIVGDMCKRWQKLNLTDPEHALLCALTLVFTDRCALDDSAKVEKIQFELVDLLLQHLTAVYGERAKRRFTKIIDNLTMMREGSDLYMKEYKNLCENEVLVEAVPLMTEFMYEEDD